ncbi:MAG TPA: FHA domain-containing protein [Desulfosporosinus sp.]|nr:FHA domain-containing protein [Desulfosporosinus sp.]
METDGVTIEVLNGVEDGKIFEFSKFPVTLGRHSSDDLYLPHDARISRHHARIVRDGGSFSLEDIGREGKGSTNGTYLNGIRIAGKTLLSSGDTFLVGNVWLRFRVV